MKQLLLALALLLSGNTYADAPEIRTIPQADGSVMIHLTRDIVDACTAQGGCSIISRAGLEQLLHDAKKTCGTTI